MAANTEQPLTPTAASPVTAATLNSNNPFNTTTLTDYSEKELATGLDRSQDSDKHVLGKEQRSDSSFGLIPVDSETPAQPPAEPVREANKEVLSSWQSKSQDESGPISMAYHESSQTPQGTLMDDIKGPPPAYDSLSARQARSASDDLLTPASTLEPDGGSNSIPKPEDKTAVGQFLSWIPPPPQIPPAQMPPLVQPVIIPQLDIPPEGESVPFARCYSDVLASHGVSIRDFTAFLDGLALAQAPNATLQGLKMFGVGVSSVPIPFIPLAGKGIKALASTGSGHSGSRSRLYFERARKEYFEPRGLSLTVLRDKDLNERLQIPSHAYRLAPLTKTTLGISLRERRMAGLAPYTAPLRFDVPEQDKQIKGVHKLARKHLDSKIQGDARRLSKLREKQWQDITLSSGEYGAWDERYAAKMSELRRTQLDLVKLQRQPGFNDEKSSEMKEMLDALWKDQRELQQLISERQMALQNLQGRTEGVEAEMKEENWSRALKWIVIENLQ